MSLESDIEVLNRSLEGGLAGYVQRMRASHWPTFPVARDGERIHGVCTCGNPGCTAAVLLVHIEALKASYAAKVDDLCKETLRVGALMAVIDETIEDAGSDPGSGVAYGLAQRARERLDAAIETWEAS